MAVSQTGAAFKSLIFDGKYSRDYGVYITGEAVFNAPEREVEMISIPGRNGAFALDKGRFNNIEVTYPAGIFAGTENDFAEAISNFRNMLCSRKGYVRLEDEYNPNEYRMAVYKSGLEVEPAMLKAGRFNITFDCKPQRYLTDGETAVSVSDGDTLTNPTLFEAHPLLAVEGYGTITFGGHTIRLTNEVMGMVTLFSGRSASAENPITFDGGKLSGGNPIYFPAFNISANFKKKSSSTVISSISGTCTGDHGNVRANVIEGVGIVTVPFNAHTFYKGTSEDIIETLTATLTYSDNTTETYEGQFRLAYNGNNKFTYEWVFDTIPTTPKCTPAFNCDYTLNSDVTADSTVSVLGHPTYIDCEIGEVYKIENGALVSLNRYVDLGSKLPELSPGGTSIDVSGAIITLMVTPRWWKV